MLTRLPSGPAGSTIAGILLLGLMARKSGAICSPLVMLIGMTLYGSPISSSATDILRPFGVFQVCSSMVISSSQRLSVPRNPGPLQPRFQHVVPARAEPVIGRRFAPTRWLGRDDMSLLTARCRL